MKALADMGGKESMEILQHLLKTRGKGKLTSGDVIKAIQQAIRMIQSKLPEEQQ